MRIFMIFVIIFLSTGWSLEINKRLELKENFNKKADHSIVEGTIKEVVTYSKKFKINNEPEVNLVEVTVVRFLDGREKRFVGMTPKNLEKWRTYTILYNGLDEILEVKETKE